MKNMKKSTWITFLCVALAIVASVLYSNTLNNAPYSDEVSLISEVKVAETPAPQKTLMPLSTPSPTSKSVSVANLIPAKSEETSPPSPSPVPLTFLLPSSGETTVSYSDQELTYFPTLKEWRCHLGIDFIPADNDKVFAVADGIVENIFDDHLYGTTICITHGNDLKSYYASLSGVTVTKGQAVTAGAEIGNMGETASVEEGIHLHFYMTKNKMPMHPFGKKE